MQVVNSVSQLKSILDSCRKDQKKIGFVPTMGALHAGHLSLVSFSKSHTDVTVVSIFVNPTQFNDKEDLKNYPRTLDEDLKMLQSVGVDIVFNPSEIEMYPEPDTRVFEFGNLDKVMEGALRPGHFNGVAQIVSKLFAAVDPDKAFFGDKDFQQQVILKQMVKILKLRVEIIACPIVRELDGLAMSSRNVRLSPVQRESAPLIAKTLLESRQLAKSMEIDELKAWLISTINRNPELEVEYFEVVDDIELQSIHSWTEPKNKVGCVAVKVGKIRLIDNIRYN